MLSGACLNKGNLGQKLLNYQGLKKRIRRGNTLKKLNKTGPPAACKIHVEFSLVTSSILITLNFRMHQL
jgi:hypothetical protein